MEYNGEEISDNEWDASEQEDFDRQNEGTNEMKSVDDLFVEYGDLGMNVIYYQKFLQAIKADRQQVREMIEKKIKVIKDNFIVRNAWLEIKHIDYNAIWSAIQSDVETEILNKLRETK